MRRRKGVLSWEFARPQDVSAAVLYSASSRAGFVSGQVMRIDGGALVWGRMPAAAPGTGRIASMRSDNLGIEFLTVFGLHPVEFVDLAADLGCRNVGMGLAPFPINPHGYPRWSLREDGALRRDLVAATRVRGVSLALGEGFLVRPGSDLRDAAADLDIMRELGVRRVNVLSIDPDLGRSFDQLALFAEMSGARGMEATLEFGPRLAVSNLQTALAALRYAGRPTFRLLIDAMHCVRSGASASDLAALDPALIGYMQLCDVPLVSRFDEYMDEARFERLAPGKGELPLIDLTRSLPSDLVFGLEIPMLASAAAGMGPRERLAPCVEAARRLLDEADAGNRGMDGRRRWPRG